MWIEFEVSHTKFRNVIRVVAGRKTVAIVYLEYMEESEDLMVHLPYFRRGTTHEQLAFLWNHIATSIGNARIRAYINDNTQIAEIAKKCGFVDKQEYFAWEPPKPADRPHHHQQSHP